MTVYLVEDCDNAPGRIYAVFRHEQDAIDFANMLHMECKVEARTVFNGQPPTPGYNP